jgi:hypothetical protein
MLMTMDLTLSLDAELANLLADYDAFLVAQDPLAGFEDDAFDDAGAEDVTDDLGADDENPVDDGSPDDGAADDSIDETGEDPAVDPTAEDPPVDDGDQGGVDDSGDPADGSQEADPGVDPALLDFFLAPDELAFDLNEAAFVGRRFASEFLDFA